MRRYAVRLLTLATCTAAVIALVCTASDALASSRHTRKHHHRIGFNEAPTGTIAPVPFSRGSVCPGNARAIDCTVWPPPFDDDPDRKATSSDGG